jgi:hypothetical protein
LLASGIHSEPGSENDWSVSYETEHGVSNLTTRIFAGIERLLIYGFGKHLILPGKSW